MDFMECSEEFMKILFSIFVALVWIAVGLFSIFIALIIAYKLDRHFTTIYDPEEEKRKEKLREEKKKMRKIKIAKTVKLVKSKIEGVKSK